MERKLRIGAVGMGRAFTLMLPTFARDERIDLVAAADPLAAPREQFAKDFTGNCYDSAEALCSDPDVEAVYVASPHEHHAEHAVMAAESGKHLLVEKPMALALDDCRRMIAAAEKAGVQIVVGHSHSFDAPILRTRVHIARGKLGPLRMIHMMNFTDFLYRPRRPEELDTRRGGGAVFSQAIHQVDVARLLGGGKVARVRALTGAWDQRRPTEGAYSALLTFEDGAFASLTYCGYGHFDSDELCGWIGELGNPKDPERYWDSGRRVRGTTPEEEAALKAARNYGGADYPGLPPSAPGHHQHFGFVLAACERADLRPLPDGVMIYGGDERYFDRLPMPSVPRAEVIDELYGAAVHGKKPLHDGRWALATMEVCLAFLKSAEEGREVTMNEQVGLGE